MGIKHFFSWFRKHEILKKSISTTVPSEVDHLLIDMNGVIHEAAQRVFKYGKYAPQKPSIIIPKRLLKKVRNASNARAGDKPSVMDLYACVKSEVNELVDIAQPRKTVFLAIDGVAPMSKQNQQRQRRFRAAKERKERGGNDDAFDSTCITAGTEFMRELAHNLSKDEWIITKNPAKVIISDDSSPGEGEHKLMDWARHHDDLEGTYCVAGMDADLILLCCVLPKTHVYIMREDERRRYDYIDINRVRQDLPVRPEDLLIWSCFIGNDFLPPVPSLEIKESKPETGALDFFFENYKKPLVDTDTGYLKIGEIVRLLALVSNREQVIMEARRKEEDLKEDDFSRRFPNPLWEGDIEKYRKDYVDLKLRKYWTVPQTVPQTTPWNTPVFHEYEVVYAFMKTVQWVYLYYTKGIRATNAWGWFFPYNYSVHANLFVEYNKLYPFISYGFKKTKPSHPHEQLLRVIPPSSKHLIPSYLHEHVDHLAEKYSLFEIDRSGKRQEWEATTIVDFVELGEEITRDINKHAND
jgi:5'-3' exoribonuclease 1